MSFIKRPLWNPQNVMGSTFLGMGLVTLCFPSTVLHLSITPESLGNLMVTSPSGTLTFAHPLLKLLMSCFGAQASLCGILLLCCKMTRKTYKVFGSAILPFFLFDYWAWKAGMLTNFGALGDLLGNSVFVTCCWLGYKEGLVSQREDKQD